MAWSDIWAWFKSRHSTCRTHLFGEGQETVKPSLTYRRLGFAVIVIVVMAGAAGIAVNVGYLLVKDADNQGEVLGTVALVVSPALTC